MRNKYQGCEVTVSLFISNNYTDKKGLISYVVIPIIIWNVRLDFVWSIVNWCYFLRCIFSMCIINDWLNFFKWLSLSMYVNIIQLYSLSLKQFLKIKEKRVTICVRIKYFVINCIYIILRQKQQRRLPAWWLQFFTRGRRHLTCAITVLYKSLVLYC